MIPATSAVLLADKDPGRELGILGHFCLLLHDWLVGHIHSQTYQAPVSARWVPPWKRRWVKQPLEQVAPCSLSDTPIPEGGTFRLQVTGEREAEAPGPAPSPSPSLPPRPPCTESEMTSPHGGGWLEGMTNTCHFQDALCKAKHTQIQVLIVWF